MDFKCFKQPGIYICYWFNGVETWIWKRYAALKCLCKTNKLYPSRQRKLSLPWQPQILKGKSLISACRKICLICHPIPNHSSSTFCLRKRINEVKWKLQVLDENYTCSPQYRKIWYVAICQIKLLDGRREPIVFHIIRDECLTVRCCKCGNIFTN